MSTWKCCNGRRATGCPGRWVPDTSSSSPSTPIILSSSLIPASSCEPAFGSESHQYALTPPRASRYEGCSTLRESLGWCASEDEDESRALKLVHRGERSTQHRPQVAAAAAVAGGPQTQHQAKPVSWRLIPQFTTRTFSPLNRRHHASRPYFSSHLCWSPPACPASLTEGGSMRTERPSLLFATSISIFRILDLVHLDDFALFFITASVLSMLSKDVHVPCNHPFTLPFPFAARSLAHSRSST